MKTVDAIIPAYNEEATIGAVVSVLKQSPLIREVVVVSDGSTDQTAFVACTAGGRVIDLPKNAGKGAALWRGIQETDADILFLADADLRGLTVEHVAQILAPVLSGQLAMNVGLRDRGWLTPLTAHLPLISGERALGRQVAERVPVKFFQGYMIESALNYSCRSRKMDYGSVILSGLSIRRKYEKVGWPRAAIQYLKMSWQIGKSILLVRLCR